MDDYERRRGFDGLDLTYKELKPLQPALDVACVQRLDLTYKELKPTILPAN